ncbi:hypothetical protein Glove_309g140 [Diversispora epigaea]|uniref:Uncharacterized protein n=1 Tax=Diversispora epigaea TaxID=1348612 RepID=A0A397HX42_9GLOM|nr:hypothetical protein Glove_309g140 [Diversispora epigaea]
MSEDATKGFSWYLKSALAGNVDAISFIGIFYSDGTCVDIEIKKHLNEAAECDISEGQYEVGKCFYEECGTKKDFVNAIYWLNTAKENGNIDAKKLLKKIINKIKTR